MERAICIHGHFYQPPRENPWLEEVEMQDSAYPYHDWNERINAECYAPNTASRIVDAEGRVVVIGNNYANISFNFGPTLLSWMERHALDTYQSVIEADRLSKERFSGHGSAIAQAYNHMILPLATQRDKFSQVYWGIKDFEKRFDRHPEGMWLPETAVDVETLDILAEQGIKFTLLSPYQARYVRKIGEHDWVDVGDGRIDPTMPYRCTLPSGRHINIFFYDGHVAQAVAFSDLLKKGENFANRLISVFSDASRPQLVHIATDGETYGHHHQFGDMALAYCLNYIEENNLAKITNYGEYLEQHPPSSEVTIIENSSWSCYHGVERWRSNCGCNSGMHPGWTQQWRKPLRDAFDWLRDTLVTLYEKEAPKYLYDPWAARNDYVDVILDRSPGNVNEFFNKHSSKNLTEIERTTAIKLLEMQRNALLMYTSCGWFFDEVSGIETIQVLQYSCRAIQLAEELSSSAMEPKYREYLEKIPTNIPQCENGARIYDRFVKPSRVDFLRLGAHYAISSLFDEYPQKTPIYCFTADSDIYDKRLSGKSRLFMLRALITSTITQEKARISAVVLHLGDHNINCGVHYFSSDALSLKMHEEVGKAFDRADILGVVRLMGNYFGSDNYSLANLFKDEQRKLLNKIIRPTLDQIYVSINQICGGNCTIIDFLQNMNIPVPGDMIKIMGYKVNYELENHFKDDGPDAASLTQLVRTIRRWSLPIDMPKIALKAGNWINAMMNRIQQHPDDTALIGVIEKVLALMNEVQVPLNLWKTQNIYFSMDRQVHQEMKAKAQQGDRRCFEWVGAFHQLGKELKIKE